MGINSPFSESVNGQVLVFYLGHIVALAQRRSVGEAVIASTLAAIRFFYLQAGRLSPTDDNIVSTLRSAIPRMLRGSKSSCIPLSASQLYTVLSSNLTASCNLRVRMHLTVYLLMFVGMLRYSDVQRILVHRDLFHFVKEPGSTKIAGLLLFIPCSKMDRSWNGAWVAIGATHGEFCPVHLIIKLLDMGNYVTYHETEFVGPLIRATARHNSNSLAQITSSFSDPIEPLTYDAMLKSIQPLVRNTLGIHTALHQPRSGGASAAAEMDIDSQLVCGLGRWKLGNTFEDVYLKMLDGNCRKYFAITKQLWPY